MFCRSSYLAAYRWGPYLASAAPAAKKSSSLPPLNGLASIVTLARIGDDLTRNVKLCTATAMLKVATRASRECAIIIFIVKNPGLISATPSCPLEWGPQPSARPGRRLVEGM